MLPGPIRIQEHFRLAQLQINPASFKFGVTSFESDKYVAIKDTTATGDSQLVIVEFDNNFNTTRKPNKADSAIMHPSQNIVALRAKNEAGNGSIIQIFNMDKKEKLKHVEILENIVFWRWVNNAKLAVVTTNSVYHLSIANFNEPQIKILDRAGALSGENPVQIIGYNLEPAEKWCALFGISTPDGGKTINGHIQLFLIEGAKQQLLEGHCCVFGEAYVHPEDHKSTLFCFVEKKQGEINSKLHVTEIGVPPPGQQKFKKYFDLPPDPTYPSDFPVLMYISQQYGLLFVVSKYSFLTVFELSSAQLIYRQRICNENVFVGAGNSKTGGYYVIGKEGIVYSINVDESQLVPHILNNCRHIPDVVQTVFRLASRYKLPGVDGMFVEQFNRLLVAGDIMNAAKIAASAPGTLLRNPETIAKFKQIPAQPNQPQPLIVYFQTLLDKGQLNQFESVELCGPILQQGRKQFVEQWLSQDKLTLTEQLGDLVKPYDIQLAVRIYKSVNANQKLAQAYMETGQLDLALQLQAQTGVSTDYISMIRSMVMQSPENALNVSKSIFQRDPNMNVHAVAEIFLQFNRIQEMTAFLVDCMKNNRPEDGLWQTRVLEMNLMAAPQVADAILQMNQWNQFNRNRIAQLCEQKGLYQRALENYQDPKDIKRVILNTHGIDPQFIVNFLTRLDGALTLQCMQDLLKHSRQNIQLVVSVAVQNNQRLTIPALVKIFESVSSFEGVFLFLGSLINSTNDKEIYHKYIEAAAKCNQVKELERIITEKQDCYDAEKVKNFLKEQRIPDPRPLIFLCDIHGYVDELTRYLFTNNFNKYIEIYIFKVNTQATPQVLGTLIDLEAEETYIRQLLYNIRGLCPIEPTIEEFEKRNKLSMLENWLDQRVQEGNQIPEIHNALAKIKIDTSQNPREFLETNKFYDSKIVGKFCEERDTELAVLAYRNAWGHCDEELIALTNKNEMYRVQAKYLVERQSKDLWSVVLQATNVHRKFLIDYIIQALTDSKNVDEVSTAVQAFVAADIPFELLGLLEKLVLHNAEFGQYKKLQNLLIITAIKSERSKVLDYIGRLDNFDGPEIAEYALQDDYRMYEEAFAIYRKFDLHVEAADVLLNRMGSLARAHEFAEKVAVNDVWSKVANAYLNNAQVNDAIEAFIKAGDTSQYLSVISLAENEGKWDTLIKYLLMCRGNMKDVNVDNSLAFCYAKLEKNTELETLLQNSNSVDPLKVGDRCYDHQLYEAAKLLYVVLKNNAKIASCLVRLKQFSKALESATKANTSKTWKELCYACVEASEFKYAAQAAQNIIIVPDLLEGLSKHYEEYNAQEEMMLLLENALNMPRAHQGIFTELAILYCHYKPKRVLEHCRQYFKQMNVLKVLRTCERMCLWAEAVYMHTHYDQPDNAINIIIEHSPSAFSHDILVSLLQKVTNKDLCFKAITFYLEEQPEQLNELLRSIQQQLDLSKFVKMMKKNGYIALVTPFLQSVQNVNNREVNDALNEIYTEAEEHELLRESVMNFDNFDQIGLARQTQSHELMEFRRIAAFLYRRGKKYDLSLNLSKQDEVYRDAVETAQESQNPKLVQDLLEFFIQKGEKEFFTVCLYTCYDLLRPDTVMELSWRAGLMEFAMPFFIQVTSELTNRVETVQKKHEDREKKEEANAKKQQSEALEVAQDLNYMVPQQLMLQAGPASSTYGTFPQTTPLAQSYGGGFPAVPPQYGSGYGSQPVSGFQQQPYLPPGSYYQQ